VLFEEGGKAPEADQDLRKVLAVVSVKYTWLQKRILSVDTNTKKGLAGLVRKMFSWSLDGEFLKRDIDIIYFVSPTRRALAIKSTPFIFTIWDLCFLENNIFPELSDRGQVEIRDDLYRRTTKKSIAIIVESEHTRKLTISAYGVPKEKIFIRYFSPSHFVYNYPRCNSYARFKDVLYIYYPAQLWPHKNHAYIIKGVSAYNKNKISNKINIIFSGYDKGNMGYLSGLAYKEDMIDSVFFIGYVSDYEYVQLMMGSLAMVMTSYLGPMNIPPLDAFFLSVPVIYGNIPDANELVGDAALLCDLDDPNDLAAKLEIITNNDLIRSDLVAAGKKRLEYFKYKQLDYLYLLEKISPKIHTWK